MEINMISKKDQDTNADEAPSTYPFEGCEKRLVIKFKPITNDITININNEKDLRSIPKTKWIEILKHAKCSILSTITNDECIAHLLSESSLFIFKQHLMIKTCGTTTLLNIIPILNTECANHGVNLEIDNIFYSRSNFMFPAAQPLLYQSFENETKFIDSKIKIDAVTDKCGDYVTFGKDAKWNCYKYGDDKPEDKGEKTLEIVMFDLDPKCMEIFFTENRTKMGMDKECVDKYVVNHLCIPEDAQIDAFLFEPCGYSLNGLLNDKYWSVHVTPENNSSFISVETNYDYDNYESVIDEILKSFKPKRFGFAINSFGKCCTDKNDDLDFSFDGFESNDNGYYEFAAYHDVKWLNYCLDNKKNNNLSIVNKNSDHIEKQAKIGYNHYLYLIFLFLVLFLMINVELIQIV